MTYPQGRYRYHASDGFFWSGNIRGPFVGIVNPPPPPPTFPTWSPGTVVPLGNGESLAAVIAGSTTWSPAGVSGSPVTSPVGSNRTGLTTVNADITLANGHATYTNLDIYGHLIGRCTDSLTNAAHVCVSNSVVRGGDGTATSITACATGTSFDFGAAVFVYCSFDATGRENPFKDGIDGGGFTAKYCEMVKVTDAVGINAIGKVTLLNCRMWSGRWFAWYNTATGTGYTPGWPSQASRDTHNDGTQWQTGTNVSISGCFIGGIPYYNATPIDSSGYSTVDPQTVAGADIIAQVNQGTDYKNSGIIIQNSTGGPALSGTVNLNWIAGGAARINIATSAVDKMAGVTVRDNKLIRTVVAAPRITSPGFEIYMSADCAATITNNTHVEDGTAITVTTH